MGDVMGVLTGLGLASSAGLNAYIPALITALLARFTNVVTLPEEFEFLSSGWVLGTLIALVIVETVVDKVPGADHINDVVSTLIRPTSGGVLFAAGSEQVFGDRTWLALLIGFIVAFGVHATKAAARGLVNVTTGGLGAPVVSVGEDVLAFTGAFVAILAPVFVIGFIAVFAWALWKILRRRRLRAQRTQQLAT